MAILLCLGCAWISVESERSEKACTCVVVATGAGGWASV